MKSLLITAVAVVSLMAFAACQTATEPKNTASAPAPAKPASPAPSVDSHGHADEAPRITLAEAKKEFDAGNVVFVDTRAESQFSSERIKGSINIPMEAFEAQYKSIPQGKKIVAYCS